jgi:ubiquinone/menaquinone biosynthesis C-methylase UbiE
MATNDSAFTGNLPQLYDRELGDVMFSPYARDMVHRLSGLNSGRLLETAAGTGIVTQALAAALPPSVEIVATDLNQPMLDHAAAKKGMEMVHFQQANALALPFPDHSFDVVVCQFGIMFFPDRIAGMCEARRVLKPGGKFLFSVWGPIADNPVMAVTVEALAKRYPAHPNWFLERTPCGYHDSNAIQSDLESAGFTSAKIETVKLTGNSTGPRAPALGFCQGSPMMTEIESVDPDGVQASTDAAEALLRDRFGSGPFRTDLVAIVIETIVP